MKKSFSLLPSSNRVNRMVQMLEKDRRQLSLQLFLQGLKKIFAAMDEKYQEIARCYNFFCESCQENCCRSLFFHHTFIEFLYIEKGYHALEPEKQAEVKNRAQAIGKEYSAAIGKNRSPRPMCPLNFGERCLLYSHRPMICRLHGLPHEFRIPGKGIVAGTGCETFNKKFVQRDDLKIDRTPFYIEMAELEKEFKLQAGIKQKLKMTIAEMINSFGE